MKKFSFLLFCIASVCFSIWLQFYSLSFSSQVFWSVALIALLGIPHGAIDHVLFEEKNREQKSNNGIGFYSFYFGLILLYFIAWIKISMWSLVLFLAISAYHFGQSQFSDLKNVERTKLMLIFSGWGTSILSGLLWYNHAAVISLFQSSPDLTELLAIMDLEVLFMFFSGSTIFTFISILWLGFAKKIPLQRMTFELLTLLLIHLCFYTLPLLIAFTIYFTTLHSLAVMSEEFEFLKKKRVNFSFLKFVKLLLPFTLLSIGGSFLIIVISRMGSLGVSDVLMVFILLSLVTLPHSIVMDKFYESAHQE